MGISFFYSVQVNAVVGEYHQIITALYHLWLPADVHGLKDLGKKNYLGINSIDGVYVCVYE